MNDQTREPKIPPYFRAPGFAESYWIELLFNQQPAIDVDVLDARLRADAGGQVAIRQVDGGTGIVTVAFPEHIVKIDGKEGPSLTNLVWSDARINIGEYKAPLEQTWEWNGARKALGRCYYKMLIGDITGAQLPYDDRLRLISSLAVACSELTQPLAVHWKEAGCLVEPARLGEMLARACNVRLFEYGIRGENFMDTLGLAALGLPDLEIAFTKIEPGMVAGWLYHSARYLFDRGDVIGDGDTVPGPGGERWPCHHGDATVEPARTVVRVLPGPPYAASPPTIGKR